MIDFHCHLDLYPNALKLLKEVAARNQFTLVVTTSPRAWQATSRVFAGYDNIKVALGMHPEIIGKKIAERESLISNIAKTDFIGEIGLDGSKDLMETRMLQQSVLKDVFVKSESCGGKILSIHSRNAATHVLDLIEQHCRNSLPVLHWFSGTIQETHRAVNLGCWFSVGPAMLRGTKGKNIFKVLPMDRVLPETDGPFAKNGTTPFMPWEAMNIVEHAAGVWNTSKNTASDQLKHNLALLLSNIR